MIPWRNGIEERPAVVAARSRLGDWEADTIVGAGHRGAMVSLVERQTRYTLLAKLEAATTIFEKMQPYQSVVFTITADNGKEFAGHQPIAAALQADFYFPTPYPARERGLNENTNGLGLQYFPKGTGFATITAADVQRVENLLNARPKNTRVQITQ